MIDNKITTRFDGGITDNIREEDTIRVFYAENVILDKNLVSQTTTEQKNSSNYSTYFNIIKMIETSGSIYGIGQDIVANLDTTIYKKSVGTANNWSAVTNGTVSSSTLNTTDPFFVIYNNDVYFDGGNSYICKYSGTTMTTNWSSLSASGGLRGGVVWQGYLYGYYGQKIYKVNLSTATTTEMITIPAEQTIKQIISYGNYLAIICSSSVTTSKMYLWDGVTTTSFADIVNIKKALVVGGNILDGSIYAVAYSLNRQYFTILKYESGIFIPKVTYKARYNRAQTQKFVVPSSVVKSFDNHIYFIVNGTRSDSTVAHISEAMIFRYGRTSPELSNYALSIWKTIDSTPTGSGSLSTTDNDFIVYESLTTQLQPQYCAVVLPGLPGANLSDFFETSSTYSTSVPGVIETNKIWYNDMSKDKELKVVKTFTEYLPSSASVTIKYKKDGDTTWTTIGTTDTDGSSSKEMLNIESNGSVLPTGKELQFRFELLGGAQMIGYQRIIDIQNNTDTF